MASYCFLHSLHDNISSARLDRDGERLLVFFVGVVVFRVAAAVYLLTDLLVAAAPVVMLASGIARTTVRTRGTGKAPDRWFIK